MEIAGLPNTTGVIRVAHPGWNPLAQAPLPRLRTSSGAPGGSHDFAALLPASRPRGAAPAVAASMGATLLGQSDYEQSYIIYSN